MQVWRIPWSILSARKCALYASHGKTTPSSTPWMRYSQPTGRRELRPAAAEETVSPEWASGWSLGTLFWHSWPVLDRAVSTAKIWVINR